jgi:hypothetical protein
MKLAKTSEQLMKFFLDNKCINHAEQTKKTDRILEQLYKDVYNADKYLNTLKSANTGASTSGGDVFYKLDITKITTVNDLPKPENFNIKAFPHLIRKHIELTATYDILYTFSSFGRTVRVHFIVEDHDPELHLETYHKHVENIALWLHIVNEYGSKACAKELTIYLYFTSLPKMLPNSNINVLDEHNVNTAFTTTCPKVSEIVIFRKEEWFKVLIHESMHNFGLDFSDMDNEACHGKILSIFEVKSVVNLYEAYCEFWACIMNSVICSYKRLENKSNIDEFLENCEFFINFERTFSFFQAVKTLQFMGLNYYSLYSKNRYATMVRQNLYKENTNVLAYYVLKLIVLNNYQGFLSWCNVNNFSLLQFKKTQANQLEFVKFIEKNYKTKSMLQGIACMEAFLEKTLKSKQTKKSKHVLNTMRMTICEMG